MPSARLEKLSRFLRNVVGDEIRKTGLEDRDFGAFERRDPVRVLIDASNVVTEIGKTGAGDEPNIASPDYRQAHIVLPVDVHKRCMIHCLVSRLKRKIAEIAADSRHTALAGVETIPSTNRAERAFGTLGC